MKYLFALVISLTLFPSLHAQYILTFNASQMNAYAGKDFKIRVYETANNREVGRKTMENIGNSFSIPLYVLLHGHSYTVDFYVDVNENGVYDPPPSDASWRRTVNNAMQATSINFVADDVFTDTGFPDPLPFSIYQATWGGKWRNLTFGSTDSIRSSISIICDSISGNFITAGLFGNPQTVIFAFEDERPQLDGMDVVNIGPPAGWTGSGTMSNGVLQGSFSMGGLTLAFTGTVGATQMLALYTVAQNGNVFANGYFYIRQLEITDSSPTLSVGLDGISQVSCSGANDGTIAVHGNGGSLFYSYQWSTGATTQIITNLSPGEYCVTVTDTDGCTAAQCFQVTEPTAMSVGGFVVDAGCFGSCDGLVTTNITGGTPSYNYIWSDGTTGDTLAQCTGTYTVTVTDANGCNGTTSFTINEPDPLVVTVVSIIPETNGEDNGILEVNVNGGTPPFLYSLTGSAFQTSPVFTNLPSGTYTLRVIDGNGCEIEYGPIDIPNISATQDIKAIFSVFPNPATDVLRIESDAPVSVELTTVEGKLLLQSNEKLMHQFDVSAFPAGTYVIVITDGFNVTLENVVIE